MNHDTATNQKNINKRFKGVSSTWRYLFTPLFKIKQMSTKVKVDELVIDGTTYVPKDSVKQIAPDLEGMKYCVVRTYSAGVHIGYVQSFGEKHPQHVKLINSRRLHFWENACSLSQVAIDGVDENKSRIAMELPEIELTDVIEVIPCSNKAMKFFKNAKVWKK